MTDDRLRVGQVDCEQRKLLCHKGVYVNDGAQPKPQAFEIIIFEIGSVVAMKKLG